MSTVILFNKPFGVLSQFTPESGHAALDTFGFPPGVYAAGRLDHDSEGALLLTDNGKLIKKLLDPKFEHPRTYLAQVDGQITDYEGYKNRAQIAAFKSQYELYPNQPLVDIHGNPIGESNWQDVFDKRKFRPDNTPIDVWEQIVDMRDIYTKIMEQLNYYK